MNDKNLIPMNQRSPKEKEAIQRAGGIASGKVRRRKRDLKRTLNAILDLPLRQGKVHNIRSIAGSKGKNITAEQAILLAQVNKALRGDTRAATFIRDTAGFKPSQKVEVEEIATTVLTEVFEDKQ